MTVPFAECDLNSLFNLVGAGLPCSKTNCWDLIASIKSESLSVTNFLSVERLSYFGYVEVFKDGETSLEGNNKREALISTYLVC